MNVRSMLGLSTAAFCICITVAACDTMNIPAGGAADLLKNASASPTSDKKPDDVSPSQLASFGNQQYDKEVEERKQKNEIETNTGVISQMDRIFEQLKSAALADQEYSDVAKGMDWRLNTIRDKTIVMAKAYPGGGVAIYDGVFSVAENEGALASILGHEMAHVLAHHWVKRMVGHTAVAGATVGSAIALALKPDKRERQVATGVTGVLALGYLVGGRQLWERSQEYDADCLGLKLAAKAGYDPIKIEGFWRRMESNKEEANTKFQFLNDHPITPDRLEHIQNTCMSKAQEAYDQVEQKRRQNALALLPGVGLEG